MAIVVNKEKTSVGGRVTQVQAGGLAEELGIQPGDLIVEINGSPVRDVLDVMYLSADESEIAIEIERGGSRYEVEADYDGDLGLEFEAWTFDGIRRCRNRCMFCFVDQLPPGMRDSLYVKDDDYRYSVLCGNFVTLTNLSNADWARLAEQRPGPLRVSVHATDLALRRRLLGNPKSPDILEQLRRLAGLHIPVHCQVVLVPGVNDGWRLEKTVKDLAALYPTVQSMAVVPVGRTKYGGPNPLEARRCERGSLSRSVEIGEFSPTQCRDLVATVSAWQEDFRREYGVSLVYAADELYLRAGRPVPSARRYDGFPQYENGIGLVRSLLDDWRDVRKNVALRDVSFRRATAVCGTAIASVLSKALGEVAELGGPRVDLAPVENEFFGATVTVSGLLTAADVLSALAGRDLGEVVILPRAMLDSQGKLTLDDQTPESIATKLGRPVRFAGTIGELLGAQQ